MKLSVPIRIAFTLVVVAAALWAATNKRLYDIAVFNVLVSVGLAAIIVLHLRVKPSWRDAAGVAAGAGTLAVVYFKVFPLSFYSFWLVFFLGLAGFVGLAVCAGWARRAERKRVKVGLLVAFFSFVVGA